MNYQEEAQRHEILEEQWARDDEHVMRTGGYSGPVLSTRPPGLTCGEPDCDNRRPFDGTANYDTTRADGWRFVRYGLSLRNYVDPVTGWVVRDRPRHWVCPKCARSTIP